MNTQSFLVHSRELYQSAIVELFVLDVSGLMGEACGTPQYVFRFCNEMNERGQPVVWQGQTYTPMPIMASGFGESSDGPASRPVLTLSNVMGMATALIGEFKGLVGARITRKRTFAKYLDAVNFKSLTNPDADPNSFYNDEFYFVERKTGEDLEVATFELASVLDLEGVLLPRRIIVNNTCTWTYRNGEDCPYNGPPVADENDTPTNIIERDKCSKKVAGCKLRFPGQPLPFSAFVTTGGDNA